MSSEARSERPIRRWISAERPEIEPRVDSRGVRSSVARGSIAYSEVSHPSPVSRRNGGTRPSTVTLHTTTVSPARASTLPSGYFTKSRVSCIGRGSSSRRPSRRSKLAALTT